MQLLQTHGGPRLFGMGLLGLGVLIACLPAPARPQGKSAGPAEKKAEGDKDADGSYGINLLTDSNTRKRLATAADYIKAQAWTEAIRLLQGILEAKDDVFVPVHRTEQGGRTRTQWVSARLEAEHLLGSMPANGSQFYELQFGARARDQLDRARAVGDMGLVERIMRRFFHTRAGREATVLLAGHHLDRGRSALAARCYARLLNDPAADLAPVTLFQAALAFHLAGDAESHRQAWKKLSDRLANGGVRLGERLVSLEQLRVEIERRHPESARAGDWPLFRGDAGRSARG